MFDSGREPALSWPTIALIALPLEENISLFALTSEQLSSNLFHNTRGAAQMLAASSDCKDAIEELLHYSLSFKRFTTNKHMTWRTDWNNALGRTKQLP
jgi:hypothetical protein